MSYAEWCPTCFSEVVSVTRGIPSMGTCANGHRFDRRDALRRKPEPKDEITRLRAQLAAAEADKLAAMERVRARAIKIAKDCVGVHYGPEVIATTLRDLDLDALAEGDR